MCGSSSIPSLFCSLLFVVVRLRNIGLVLIIITTTEFFLLNIIFLNHHHPSQTEVSIFFILLLNFVESRLLKRLPFSHMVDIIL